MTLAHNHPSGDPAFSPKDRRCAKRLQEAGKLIGVKLLDFLTIGSGGSHQSAAARGVIKDDSGGWRS